jgi:hypothetical protein
MMNNGTNALFINGEASVIVAIGSLQCELTEQVHGQAYM